MSKRQIEAKWFIKDSPLPIYDVSLDIKHRDCVMTEFSKRLRQSLIVHVPTECIEDGIIHVYFAIPQSLTEKEIEGIFRDFNGNLEEAVIYTSRGKPTFFDVRFRDDPIRTIFELTGSTVERYAVYEEKEFVQIELRGLTTVDLINKLPKEGMVNIKSVTSRAFEPAEGSLLTPREIELLQCLIQWGYFTLPTRQITLQEAATRLNISDSQLSLELRNIANKVFTEYLRRATRFEYPRR